MCLCLLNLYVCDVYVCIAYIWVCELVVMSGVACSNIGDLNQVCICVFRFPTLRFCLSVSICACVIYPPIWVMFSCHARYSFYNLFIIFFRSEHARPRQLVLVINPGSVPVHCVHCVHCVLEIVLFHHHKKVINMCVCVHVCSVASGSGVC